MQSSKKDIISKLQKDILLWQGFTPPPAGQVKGIGLGPLEAAFPNGVFPTGCIHELLCPTPEHTAATGGLIGGLLSTLMQQGGACIWISTARKLFPPALTVFNVMPHRIVFIDVQRDRDVLWAMEEALKCKGLAAVIAEVHEISFAQSRRLQLAVEDSKVTGFLLRTNMQKLSSTICVARWQVSPLPSVPEPGLPGVSHPRWQIDLLRVRNGNPGTWQLEWRAGRFVPVVEIEEQQVYTQIA